jgi:uncharacterized protein (DUF2461 family)
MVASGNYMMQSEDLERYRHAVAEDVSGEELTEILAALRRRRSLQVGPGGLEPLKTVPRGFPRDHPRAELLRQKGLIAMRTRPASELQNGPRLRSFVLETFEMCSDLTDWLGRYVGGTSES